MTCYFTHSPLELKSKTHSSWLIKILKFDIKLEYSLFYPQDLESSITLVPVYNETFKREEICCVCVCVCVYELLSRVSLQRDSPGKNSGVGCHFLLQKEL